MNILVVGGNGMFVTDGSEFWGLKAKLEAMGHSVRNRECLESGRTAKLNIDDVLWAESVICYSYGCASVKEIWHTLAKTWNTAKTYANWIIIAGVPDLWMKQLYGSLWHKPGFVDVATCFQVNAIPASCPILSVPSYLFGHHPEFIGSVSMNILCDKLVPNSNLVERHTTIQNNQAVLDLIVKLFSKG